MVSRKLVIGLVFVLLAVSIFQTSFIVYKSLSVVSDHQITAKASSGAIIVCINDPPVISYPCNATIYEHDLITCQLNASDPDPTDLLWYDAINISGNLEFFVASDGLAIAEPEQKDVGQSTVRFIVKDDRDCSNSESYVDVNFTVINVNDPPYYVPEIPEIYFRQGDSVRGIFLRDNFVDPDGDVLRYTHSTIAPGYSLQILSNSEIVVSSSVCGETGVVFTAWDPFNLSASSGLITINVPCQERTPPPSFSGGSGGFSRDCKPEWVCDDWDRCLINGTQSKRCTDVNACNEDYIRYFWQNCTYIPQCENGVQDFNEEGVDCGGPCPVCETCTDGILNNKEEQIDCGGPNCAPCPTCDDWIQNCHRLPDGSLWCEEGIDCGGPCDAICSTCDDGIKNCHKQSDGTLLCEEGIDCGGPCKSCHSLNVPDMSTESSRLGVVLTVIFSSLAIALILYRIFHTKLQLLFAHLMWFLLKNKKKQILLSQEQKDDFLKRLKHIEEHLLSKKSLSPIQITKAHDALSDVHRDLYATILQPDFELQNVQEQIEALNVNTLLKNSLFAQYDFLLVLDHMKKISSPLVFLEFELLRERIYSIAELKKHEIARPLDEYTLKDTVGIDKLVKILYNLVLALQFRELSIAEKLYIQALETYDSLSPEEQTQIYAGLHLVFEEVSYVASFSN